jgi:hypothetical protein
MSSIILVGGGFVVVMFLLLVVAGSSIQRQGRRTGIPRPSVWGILSLFCMALVGCACSSLFFGGPEVLQELARRRQVASVSQPASATVESHQCRLALNADTEVVYTFPAPDPATGRTRTYRGQEILRTPGEATCQPRPVPYPLAVRYDPADPQRVTAQPVISSDLARPVLLLLLVGGGCGLLPLALALNGVWLIVRLVRPSVQPLLADVRLMEEAGFMLALERQVVAAARAGESHALMGRYVCRYNGHLYISLDFLRDPAERNATWNALWRYQSMGVRLGTDDIKVEAVLRGFLGSRR